MKSCQRLTAEFDFSSNSVVEGTASRPIIFSVGIKQSMCHLICDVNYCAWVEMLRRVIPSQLR